MKLSMSKKVTQICNLHISERSSNRNVVLTPESDFEDSMKNAIQLLQSLIAKVDQTATPGESMKHTMFTYIFLLGYFFFYSVILTQMLRIQSL